MRKFPAILTFLYVLVISSACVHPVVMEGDSMKPTIKNGDRMFITSSFGELQHGDIIMFRYPRDENKSFLKRVIGLPGERIAITGKKVLVNGQVRDEPYLDQTLNQTDRDMSEMIIEKDNYFVMGDNRDNSSDSRVWGTVGKDLITGKYYMTYYSTEKNGRE